MPSETIGDCGCAQFPDKGGIRAELELGICYLRHACGAPPPGFELEIIWHEHDLGEYAAIGITWDGPGDAPWDYIRRAERALARFDEAVAWSELAPQPEEESEESDVDKDELGGGASEQAVQQTQFPSEHGPSCPIELYRRDEMKAAAQAHWRMALLIFQEMGWQPKRPLETYDHPFAFVTQDEGEAMQRAGRSLLAQTERQPFLSASVRMDLGLFYRLTEFVGGGAFIVSRPGAYERAKEEDFAAS